MQLEFVNNGCDLVMQFFELAIPEVRYFSAASLLIGDLKHVDHLAAAVQLVVDYLGLQVDHCMI